MFKISNGIDLLEKKKGGGRGAFDQRVGAAGRAFVLKFLKNPNIPEDQPGGGARGGDGRPWN